MAIFDPIMIVKIPDEEDTGKNIFLVIKNLIFLKKLDLSQKNRIFSQKIKFFSQNFGEKLIDFLRKNLVFKKKSDIFSKNRIFSHKNRIFPKKSDFSQFFFGKISDFFL
jgi:hypothetical protein